jgi:beta-glucosidase
VQVTYASGSNPQAAAALAKRSTLAIVVVASYQTEGADLQCLSLECPNAYGYQDALIGHVAAANPNTIVVLENGCPVLTPWRDQIKGLIDAWYPGEQGGAAIARVLFGDVNPSGHLPITFPQSYSQESMAGDPAAYPGIVDTVTYKEGVFVGYRWFDQQHLTPAFPFGFGLSYTRFRFAALTVRPAATAAGPRAIVRFTVRNIGPRAGADVAQLYLALPLLAGGAPAAGPAQGLHRGDARPGRVGARSTHGRSACTLLLGHGRGRLADR